MNILNNKSNLIIFCLLSLFIGISLFIRIYFPFNQIFTEYGIKFNGSDSYYHMRLIDTLTNNFPHLTYFDTYFQSPYGNTTVGNHFFDWMISSINWIIGLGHPSQHLIDVIGVLIPVILASLVIIPVYFIGKTLFNKWVGLIGAGLISILGGEFMGRSILGATDHHVAEVLFSTTCLMFLILAIKSTSKHKFYLYSIFAGLFMGIYLLTWQGGLLFIVIVLAYFIIQIIINHFQKVNNSKLALTGVILFGITLLLNYSQNLPKDTLFILTLSFLIPLFMGILSNYFLKKNRKFIFFATTLILACVSISLFVFITNFPIFNLIFDSLKMFIGAGSSAQTTMELQPILSPAGKLTTAIVWGNFATCYLLAPIALVILTIQSFKNKFDCLFIIWTLVILVITLMQRRFAYYLAVNFALLSGYLLWRFIAWFGQGKVAYKPKGFKKKQKEKVERKLSYYKTAFALMLMIIAVFIPVLSKSVGVAQASTFVPSNAWQSSLTWLKDNSPEPFGQDIYNVNQVIEKNKIYPIPDYGVTAWWDYGYWITRIAHRVPTSNPAQSPKPIKSTAQLFLSDSVNSSILEQFKTQYIILDNETTTNKYWAIINWANEPTDKYSETYYIPQNGKLYTTQLYYPEYYKSLSVRLYNFNGKAISGKPTVVKYTEQYINDGQKVKVINDYKEFKTYKEAIDYMATQTTSLCTLVGKNPFISPVDLEALDNFTLVHKSDNSIGYKDVGSIPEVKIFKYMGE